MEDENDDDVEELVGGEEIVKTVSKPLPPHVTALLYGGTSKHLKKRHSLICKVHGGLALQEIQNSLNEHKKCAPWLKVKDEGNEIRTKSLLSKTSISSILTRLTKPSPINVVEEIIVPSGKTTAQKCEEFEKMINRNVNKKIAFLPLPFDVRTIPSYVVARLQSACRSARFELPLNMRRLEKLTQLEYLSTFTHLKTEQRNRYMKIFKRYKNRANDILEYSSLYAALNSLFGGFLVKENFDILCTGLFIDESTVFDTTTFAAVCTFCDRLYWSNYLDGINTFNFWAANRTALELLDFSNLQWKLEGINISYELRCLLFSMA